MSVIVWDGKTLAADRLCLMGERKYTGRKIHRLDNGDLCAWSGTHTKGIELMAWYKEGAKRDLFPTASDEEFTRLIVVSGQRVYAYENSPFRIELLDAYHAWGSGCEFALGAMKMGASAVKAVEIASELCSSCGLGVDAFEIEPLAESQPLSQRETPA